MKITKRQLKRIIKEEKRKLLKETIADMDQFETVIDRAAGDIAGEFLQLMNLMAEEDPGMVQDVGAWKTEVFRASNALDAAIAEAINREIQRIETDLHNGEFAR
jgi:hypothetical protein